MNMNLLPIWVRALARDALRWWRPAAVGAAILVLLAAGCSRDEKDEPTDVSDGTALERLAPSGVSYTPAPLSGYATPAPQGLPQSVYPGMAATYGQAPGAAPYGTSYPPVGGQTSQAPYGTAPGGYYRDGTSGYLGQPATPGGTGDYYYGSSPQPGAGGYAQPQPVPAQTGPQGATAAGYGAPAQQPGAWTDSAWQGASGSAYPPSTLTHPSGVAPGPLPQGTVGGWPQQPLAPQSDLYPSLDYDPSREARSQQSVPAAAPAAPTAPVAPVTPTIPLYPYGTYGTYGIAPGVYPPAVTTPVQPWAGLFPFFGGLPIW